MADDFRVVLVSVPKPELADTLAAGLVENKLAACVTALPGAISHYRWEGKMEKESEVLLVIKTRAAALPSLMSYVKRHHGAKVPEIISLPILEGNQAYLEWIAANVNP